VALDGHQERVLEATASALGWSRSPGTRCRGLQSARAATLGHLWAVRAPPPCLSVAAMEPGREARTLCLLEQLGVAVIHRGQHLAEAASGLGGLELVGTASLAVVVLIGGGLSLLWRQP
jgi:hypothetical protein